MDLPKTAQNMLVVLKRMGHEDLRERYIAWCIVYNRLQGKGNLDVTYPSLETIRDALVAAWELAQEMRNRNLHVIADHIQKDINELVGALQWESILTPENQDTSLDTLLSTKRAEREERVAEIKARTILQTRRLKNPGE